MRRALWLLVASSLVACDYDDDFATFCRETGRCDAGVSGPADGAATGDGGSAADGGNDAGRSVDAGGDAGMSEDGGRDAGLAQDGGTDAGPASDGGGLPGARDAGDADPPAGDDGGSPDAGSGGPTLAFTTAEQNVLAGACSGAVGVGLVDAAGALVPFASQTAIGLSSATAVQFFQDASCGSLATVLGVSAGATQATFYFRQSLAGDVPLTADAGALGTVSQQGYVGQDHLSFSGLTATAQQGDCLTATLQSHRGSDFAQVSSGDIAQLSALPDGCATFHPASVGCQPTTDISSVDFGGRSSLTIQVKVLAPKGRCLVRAWVGSGPRPAAQYIELVP